MEVDTVASITVISDNMLCHTTTSLKLLTYTEEILVLGELTVKVQYQEQVEQYQTVVAGDGPNLLGRDWLAKLSSTGILFNSHFLAHHGDHAAKYITCLCVLR